MRLFSRTSALIVALLIVGLFVQVGSVSAHAELVSSTPAAGSTVNAAPSKVVAAFSEELKAEGSLLKVTDSKGAVVDNGDTTLDRSDAERKTLVVTLKANLPADTYTVNWTSASTDGHSESNSFSFKIAGAASSSAPAAPSTSLPATGAGDMLPLAALLVLGLAALGAGVVLRRARS